MTHPTSLSTTLTAGAALLCASSAMAVITPVSYDFGTDSGRTTFGDAGFTAASTNATEVEITDVAQGVEIRRNDTGAGGFENAALLQDFTGNGLGGGATNDFTVSTRFTITEWDVANVNNDRFGAIQLFSDTADAAGIDSGISFQLWGDSGTDNDDFSIRTGGPNGSVETETDLGFDFALNDVFDLTVVGTFSGTTLSVDFSVVRNGGTAQTISTDFDAVTDAAILDGAFSGVAERFKDSTGTEYSSFSIVPEPASLALMGLGGLMMLGRGRRQA